MKIFKENKGVCKMSKKQVAIFSFLFLSLVAFAAAKGKVYVTPTGQKYHEPTCRTIARSKNVCQLTVEQAKAKGYGPCKVCKP